MTVSPKIAVIYYSLYGHVAVLAKAAADAAKAKGATVDLWTVPETFSADTLKKLGAPPRDQTIPEVSPADLEKYDGFIFAFPTRYGRAVAQVDALFDHTGGLWAKQALNGKFATVITSTATQHGGQETTVLTTIPFFAHHGIIFVPIGYKTPLISTLTDVEGGSPWGAAGVAASDGSRAPSEHEKELAKFHGEHFTDIVTTFVKGKNAP